MEVPYLATLEEISSEDAFMRRMLCEAASVNPDMKRVGQTGLLNRPDVRTYLKGWGRRGDYGLYALDPYGVKIGAAWARLFTQHDHGYGFVDEATPELTIAVSPECRGQGVGTNLLHALLSRLRQDSYPGLSVAVHRENRARRFYERHGFEDAGLSRSHDPSIILVKRL